MKTRITYDGLGDGPINYETMRPGDIRTIDHYDGWQTQIICFATDDWYMKTWREHRILEVRGADFDRLSTQTTRFTTEADQEEGWL